MHLKLSEDLRVLIVGRQAKGEFLSEICRDLKLDYGHTYRQLHIFPKKKRVRPPRKTVLEADDPILQIILGRLALGEFLAIICAELGYSYGPMRATILYLTKKPVKEIKPAIAKPKPQHADLVKLVGDGFGVSEISRQLKVSRQAISQYLQRHAMEAKKSPAYYGGAKSGSKKRTRHWKLIV